MHLAEVICQEKHHRPAERPQNVDDSRMRNGNDVTGLENNIVRGVPAFHQLVQIDGDRIVQAGRITWRGRVRGGSGDRRRGGYGLLRRARLWSSCRDSGWGLNLWDDSPQLRWVGR